MTVSVAWHGPRLRVVPISGTDTPPGPCWYCAGAERAYSVEHVIPDAPHLTVRGACRPCADGIIAAARRALQRENEARGLLL